MNGGQGAHRPGRRRSAGSARLPHERDLHTVVAVRAAVCALTPVGRSQLARHVATPKTRALLGERVAWAAARAGDVQVADTALLRVEKDYDGQQSADQDPEWVYWLSPEEVEVMAGRVWTQTRRPLRAVPILERAIEGYGDDTGRETALYQSWMAESLEQANEPDRAAAAATKALRLSRQAGSVRADDRVTLLRRKLRKHRGNAAVDAFLEESA
jgi:hypothetical protein